MGDPRAALFDSLARIQEEVSPRVGDVYLRDGDPLIVTARAEDELAFRTASGATVTANLRAFRTRAVEEVDSSGGAGSYIDNVWQLASSQGIPRDVRSLAVQKAARRAPSEGDALTVRRWASTLSSGREPTRKP